MTHVGKRSPILVLCHWTDSPQNRFFEHHSRTTACCFSFKIILVFVTSQPLFMPVPEQLLEAFLGLSLRPDDLLEAAGLLGAPGQPRLLPLVPPLTLHLLLLAFFLWRHSALLCLNILETLALVMLETLALVVRNACSCC